jgi:hypothetical protein
MFFFEREAKVLPHPLIKKIVSNFSEKIGLQSINVQPYMTTPSKPANLATYKEHKRHREERPSLRTSSSIIVVTPPRASDFDFTLDDRQRDPRHKRHRCPCRPIPNSRPQACRGGGSSDFNRDLHSRKLHTLH